MDKYFRMEASELLEKIYNELYNLEKSSNDSDTINNLLRHIHTLKGSAQIVNLQALADIIHSTEDEVILLRGRNEVPGRKKIHLFYERFDKISNMIERL